MPRRSGAALAPGELKVLLQEFEDGPIWPELVAEWTRQLDPVNRCLADPKRSIDELRVAQGERIGINRAMMVLRDIKTRLNRESDSSLET